MKRIVSLIVCLTMMIGFVGCEEQSLKEKPTKSSANPVVTTTRSSVCTTLPSTVESNDVLATQTQVTSKTSIENIIKIAKTTCCTEEIIISSTAAVQRKTLRTTVKTTKRVPKVTTRKPVQTTKKVVLTKRSTKRITTTTQAPFRIEEWVQYAKDKAIEYGYKLDPTCTESWDTPMTFSARRTPKAMAKDIVDSYDFYKMAEPWLTAFWIWAEETSLGVYDVYMGRR